MCEYICLNTRKLNTEHIIQAKAMYINGGAHAYYEHESITIMYTILATNVSLNTHTFVAAGPHIIHVLSCFCLNLHDDSSVSEVVEENAIPCVN